MASVGFFGRTGFKYLSLFSLATLVLSIFMLVVYGVNPIFIWQIVLGLAYLMFLPGFVLCWAMFSDDTEINYVERLGLSLGLSIPLVLAVVLAADHVFRVPVTPLNIVLSVGVVLLVLVLFGVFVRLLKGKRKVNASSSTPVSD